MTTALLIPGATLDELLSAQLAALRATLDPAKRYHPHAYEPHGDGIAIVYREIEERPRRCAQQELVP